ncbi:MAG: FkbM family methyltransferase [Bradyrhizobium sp.]
MINPPSGQPPRPGTSYAQNAEDILLNRIFRDLDDGFYVDIGAYDPVNGSVTKIFYDRGWTGINIEPGSIFRRLAAARPRDTNLQLAVLDFRGEVDFIEDLQDPGMSRVGISAAEDGGLRARDEVPRRIRCERLDDIVAHYAPNRLINFLKIDAEGTEARIVNPTDWTKLRPQVIVIEAVDTWTNDLNSEEWEPHLLASGYERVYFDGINLFFVRSEDADLRRHFAVPVNAIDGFEKFNTNLADARKQVADLRAENAVLLAERETLRAELTDALDDLRFRERLNAELVAERDRYFPGQTLAQRLRTGLSIRAILRRRRAHRATAAQRGGDMSARSLGDLHARAGALRDQLAEDPAELARSVESLMLILAARSPDA